MFGEKPQRLLNRQLYELENDVTIHKVKSKQGTCLTTIKDIKCKEFYKTLYSSKQILDPTIWKAFLKILISALLHKKITFLNKDSTPEELKETIKTLKGDKTPGPDGLPCKLYRTFADTFIPYMLNTFSHALENGSLPQTLRVVIILILKKGKDPDEVAGFFIYLFILLI